MRSAGEKTSSLGRTASGGSTAASSLSSYENAGASGARFFIDRDGTVYQTASMHKKTWHVGKLKAVEQRCTPVELAALKKARHGERAMGAAGIQPVVAGPSTRATAAFGDLDHLFLLREDDRP